MAQLIRHMKRFETCQREGAVKQWFECFWDCHRKPGICKEQKRIVIDADRKDKDGKEVIVSILACRVAICKAIAEKLSN